MKPKKSRPTLRTETWPALGGHGLALEHLVVGYALRGYNAATIRRKLKADHPDLFKQIVNENTVLWVLRRAMEYGVVTFHAPRIRSLGEQLRALYQSRFGKTVLFTVADDSIGFRHAQSLTPFFWSVAADAIMHCIESVLEERESSGAEPARVVVGNTGGPSVSESIKPLVQRGIDPMFLDEHRRRLWFLSLTSAGSARHFDCHSNYLAALMGQVYEANHLAVVNDAEESPESAEYNDTLRDLKLLIGGVGGPSGYLTSWCRSHKVPLPAGMIGDVFFSPIDREGRALEFGREAARALAPLRLRPTHHELADFLHRCGTRSLVVAAEAKGKMGNPVSDKRDVLDIIIRGGYITDCVLAGNLARRLLLKHGQKPEE